MIVRSLLSLVRWGGNWVRLDQPGAAAQPLMPSLTLTPNTTLTPKG